MSCANQTGEWHGCRAFCLFEGPKIEVLEEIFDTCTAPIDSNVYHLCAFHADSLNIRTSFQNLPDSIRALLLYICDDKQPQEFFPALIAQTKMPFVDVAKMLLSPTFFWALKPEHFAFLIYFKAQSLTQFIETEILPTEFSYLFVLDSICEIMDWIISGNEDLQQLGLSQEEMILLKWGKIMYMFPNAFLVGLGCFDTIPIFPCFSLVWKDRWNDRINEWIEKWTEVFSHEDIKKIESMLSSLVQVMEHAANEGFREPLPMEETIKFTHEATQEMFHARLQDFNK